MVEEKYISKWVMLLRLICSNLQWCTYIKTKKWYKLSTLVFSLIIYLSQAGWDIYGYD